MCTAGNTFREFEFAHRTVCEPGSLEDQAVRGVGIHVRGQGDPVTVVLPRSGRPWSHRSLASVHTVTKRVTLLGAGKHIVSDQLVEQEPARFAGRDVSVAILAGRIVEIDRGAIQRQEAERPLSFCSCPGVGGLGFVFEKAVQRDLVAFLVGDDEIRTNVGSASNHRMSAVGPRRGSTANRDSMSRWNRATCGSPVLLSTFRCAETPQSNGKRPFQDSLPSVSAE